MRSTGRSGWWAVALSSFLSIGAAGPVVPLIEAVKKVDKVAVRALLQRPIDVNLPEADGMTALHWAARLDDLQTEPERDRIVPLRLAIEAPYRHRKLSIISR